MVQLIISGENFEQDIRPLIKAFYPEELLDVYTDDNWNLTEQADITITIKLLPDKFFIQFMDDPIIEVNKEVDLSNRKEYRNNLARTLYDILKKKTAGELPWGTLTGVRPVKLIYEKVIEGQPDIDIIRYMKEQYYCSDNKSKKGIIIAKREIEILKSIDYINGYSLYIGIPFCPTTCAYCSFTSYPVEKYKEYVELYLKALHKEILHTSNIIPDKKLNTIYIGGGTPTTLNEVQLDMLLACIADYFPVNKVQEFCVEAGRPDSISKKKLQILKEYGVNRISINPQSMRQKTLDIIGRNHTASQIEEVFYMARDTGHDNINMDIIIGLSGETPQDVHYTLDKISNMQPDGLTVHTLAIKRAARLNTHKELYAMQKAAGVEEMYRITEEFTAANDYLPYYLYRQKNITGNLENTGYSKHGKEGIYNILIMEEKQSILALGAGASSKYVSEDANHIERIENVKSLKDYIERIDEMIKRKYDFFNMYYV